MKFFTITHIIWFCNIYKLIKSYHKSPDFNYFPGCKLHHSTFLSDLIINCSMLIWLFKKLNKFTLYEMIHIGTKILSLLDPLPLSVNCLLFGWFSVISMFMLEWLTKDSGVSFSNIFAYIHSKSCIMECISCWALHTFWCTPYFYQKIFSLSDVLHLDANKRKVLFFVFETFLLSHELEKN